MSTEASRPLVVTEVAVLHRALREAKRRQQTVGLVPTMGALHAGHASLLRAARSGCGFVVATVFVNPTQFGPNEDLSRYPRPLERDVALCATEEVDLVFTPTVETIYPAGFRTFVEVTQLQDLLCGASRPGHFRGVATVVLKLFNLVQPEIAWFGQKDAQQLLVIKQMVRDLDVPVEVRACPIVREPDGLALSSRNQYLDPQQRRDAGVLFQALTEAHDAIRRGERGVTVLRHGLIERIGAVSSARLDYAAIVDADTLQPLEHLTGRVLVALAVYFGTTRLIDNVLIDR